MKLEDYFLKAPCVFCGYNGKEYWQEETHTKLCPFHKIGGESDRVDHLQKNLLPYMVFLYNCTTKIDIADSVRPVDQAKLRRSSSNWLKISFAINEGITEEELLILINLEKTGKNRKHILTRLHAKYSKMRTARERDTLLKYAK